MLLKLNEAAFGSSDDINQNFFLLYYEINNQNMKDLSQFLMEGAFQEKNRPKVMNIFINSPGGCYVSTMAAISVIRGMPKDIAIRTVSLGQVASGGLMLAMSGTKGYRIVTPDTSIMSHTFLGSNYGHRHDLLAGVKDIDLAYDRMLNHYIRCTGLSVKKIEKNLLTTHDVHLSAKEALELNVFDKISDLN